MIMSLNGVIPVFVTVRIKPSWKLQMWFETFKVVVVAIYLKYQFPLTSGQNIISVKNRSDEVTKNRTTKKKKKWLFRFHLEPRKFYCIK